LKGRPAAEQLQSIKNGLAEKPPNTLLPISLHPAGKTMTLLFNYKDRLWPPETLSAQKVKATATKKVVLDWDVDWNQALAVIHEQIGPGIVFSWRKNPFSVLSFGNPAHVVDSQSSFDVMRQTLPFVSQTPRSVQVQVEIVTMKMKLLIHYKSHSVWEQFTVVLDYSCTYRQALREITQHLPEAAAHYTPINNFSYPKPGEFPTYVHDNVTYADLQAFSRNMNHEVHVELTQRDASQMARQWDTKQALEDDIQLVMDTTQVNGTEALEALEANNYDPADAVLELDRKYQGYYSKKEQADTQQPANRYLIEIAAKNRSPSPQHLGDRGDASPPAFEDALRELQSCCDALCESRSRDKELLSLAMQSFYDVRALLHESPREVYSKIINGPSPSSLPR
jgi:NACalpha-BTF3-like transcription factor